MATTTVTTTTNPSAIRTHGRNAGSGQGLLLTVAMLVLAGVGAILLIGV